MLKYGKIDVSYFVKFQNYDCFDESISRTQPKNRNKSNIYIQCKIMETTNLNTLLN